MDLMEDSEKNFQINPSILASISEWIIDLFGGESSGLSLKEALALEMIGARKFMRMSDLAGVMHLPVTTATSMVDRLAKQGLLKRSRFEDERRIVAVSLTDEGHAVWMQQRARQAAWIETRLERLSADGRNHLLELLNKLPPQNTNHTNISNDTNY